MGDNRNVEEIKMIDMILLIYIEEKKVMLIEDLIKNMKFIGEHIKQKLG